MTYENQRHRDISFGPEDLIFLNVSPTRGGMQIGRHVKLSLRYIGQFEVLIQVCEVAYEFALSIGSISSIPHIILKKYMLDGSHRLHYEELDIRPNLSTRKRICKFSIDL